MIRDPSDGSVRDVPTVRSDEPPAPQKPLPAEPDSGLPFASERPGYQTRLKESRDWIKDFHAKKTRG